MGVGSYLSLSSALRFTGLAVRGWALEGAGGYRLPGPGLLLGDPEPPTPAPQGLICEAGLRVGDL